MGIKKSGTVRIYRAVNLVNGKSYVGITRFTVAHRWTQHKYTAKTRPVTHFHRAIAKYGHENFDIMQVATCIGDQDSWAETEQAVIKSFAPEYNMTNGGEITVGKRVPQEVVDRIVAKNKGIKRTSEQNALNSERAKERMKDPELKAKCVTSLYKAHARRHEFEEKRIESIRRAATEGRMGRPMTEERKARQLVNLNTPEARKKNAESRQKVVVCTTLNAAFDSLTDAALATGIPFGSISKVCNGKRNNVYGLVFQYI